MKHVMMVTDELWEWGQKRFGVENPSDNFRLILAKEQGRDAHRIEPLSRETTKPFDLNSYSDPFPAEFAGYDWGTGAPIHRGDLICMKNKKPYLFKWVRENT
jgi:hypothetical protein